MQQTSPLHPLYFPISQRCSRCQRCAVASAVQILPRRLNRQRYFCLACAEIKGSLPTQELVERLAQMQRDRTKRVAQPGQKQSQAKVRSRGK
jgi:7,8-dihydro-6-hydroxymethylpterin-pyrophosphokinase